MAYVAERVVWNNKRKSQKFYRAKYLVEHTSRAKGQKHLLYLGMSGSPPEANIFEYLKIDDPREYFVALEQKERIRRVLEFFLYFNSIKDPEKRSFALIEKEPFRKLVIKKRLKAIDIENFVLKDLTKCAWTERIFFENVTPCLPYLWNRITLRGRKAMRLEDFRKIVGT